MKATGNSSGPSVDAGKDSGARNLSLVVLVLLGSLVSFVGYLVWTSFSVAAPAVLWTDVAPKEDPLLDDFAAHAEQAASVAIERAASEATQSSDRPDSTETDTGDEELSPEKQRERHAVVELGQRLYRNAGCNLCHGREGRGGVTNPNYQKETFPALDQMASKLGLEFPEDVDVVVDLLGVGKSLDQPAKIDVPDGAGIISAKYQTVANVILNGNPAMQKDPQGTEPIFMPSYKDSLTKSEMNQLLASFLIMYPIEEEEWDEETPEP